MEYQSLNHRIGCFLSQGNLLRFLLDFDCVASWPQELGRQSLNLIKRLSLLLYLLLAPPSFAANSLPTALEIQAIDQVQSLKKGWGYMLVDLEVAGASPSIEIGKVRLKNRKQHYLAADQRLLVHDARWSISLKDKAPGLYVVHMPEGLYQITKVNAPFFNLPFRVDTLNRPQWRFSIERARSNYIGRLRIDKERGTDYINVKLLYRLASDYDRITSDAAALFEAAPLRSGSGVRDDFLDFINPPVQ